MNQPGPGSPRFLRTRCKWAARVLLNLAQQNDGPQAFSAAALYFALDALLVNTKPVPGGGGSHAYLRWIVAECEFCCILLHIARGPRRNFWALLDALVHSGKCCVFLGSFKV